MTLKEKKLAISLSSTRTRITRATDKLSEQFIRYTIVGAIAYTADIGALALLTELVGIHYLTSAAIGFTIGLITNYILSTYWVFSARRLESRTTEFIIFALIGVVGLGINELFIWMFAGIFGIHYLIGKVMSTAFVFLWNFFVRKYVLFSRGNKRNI